MNTGERDAKGRTIYVGPRKGLYVHGPNGQKQKPAMGQQGARAPTTFDNLPFDVVEAIGKKMTDPRNVARFASTARGPRASLKSVMDKQKNAEAAMTRMVLGWFREADAATAFVNRTGEVLPDGFRIPNTVFVVDEDSQTVWGTRNRYMEGRFELNSKPVFAVMGVKHHMDDTRERVYEFAFKKNSLQPFLTLKYKRDGRSTGSVDPNQGTQPENRALRAALREVGVARIRTLRY